MSFYTSISDHYRMIFPFNPVQSKFVLSRVSKPEYLSLLDIGCGTGDLTLELARSFKKAVGIDLDKAMLDSVRKKAIDAGNIEFHHLNMMHIESHFGSNAFDTIICFGNTLVHLQNLNAISDVVSQIKRTLKQGGNLLLQIINYDRILDLNINSLPTLETDDIKFARSYNYREKLHLIEFETSLTIKKTKQVIHNTIPLFPIRKSEIEKVLIEAGFSAIHFYGNFKGDPLLPASIPMVIEARS